MITATKIVHPPSTMFNKNLGKELDNGSVGSHVGYVGDSRLDPP
jgi:hypothetical protein